MLHANAGLSGNSIMETGIADLDVEVRDALIHDHRRQLAGVLELVDLRDEAIRILEGDVAAVVPRQQHAPLQIQHEDRRARHDGDRAAASCRWSACCAAARRPRPSPSAGGCWGVGG